MWFRDQRPQSVLGARPVAIFNATMIRTLLLALGLAWPPVNPEVVKLATNVFALFGASHSGSR